MTPARPALALLLAAALGAAAHAAPARQTPAEDDRPLELRGELVLVPAAVRRAEGGAVADLAAPDFGLAEDGAPQEVAVFRHDTAPADVVLLVDASLSVEDSLDVVRTAAKAFMKQLRPGDRVSVVAFADRPVIVQDWTEDAKAAAAALRSVKAGGGTGLYGSVAAALSERFAGAPAARRRAMVVLTDGVDTLSTVTSRAAARVAQRADASVYVVSTGRIIAEAERAVLQSVRLDGRERARRRAAIERLRRAEEPLEHLAAETGGRVLYPRGSGDLSGAYREIADEIRSRYLLGYYPGGGAAGFHAIAVTVRRPGLVVYARRGYFRE